METATGLAASEEVHGSNQLYEACNIMQLDKKATSQPLLAEPEQIGEGLLVLPNPYEVFCNFSKSSPAQVHVPTTNLGMLLLGQGDCILRSKGFEGRPATANIIGTVMNLATVSLGRCCPVVSPRATNFSRDPLLTIINYVFQMGWFATSYIRWAPDPVYAL